MKRKYIMTLFVLLSLLRWREVFPSHVSSLCGFAVEILRSIRTVSIIGFVVGARCYDEKNTEGDRLDGWSMSLRTWCLAL